MVAGWGGDAIDGGGVPVLLSWRTRLPPCHHGAKLATCQDPSVAIFDRYAARASLGETGDVPRRATRLGEVAVDLSTAANAPSVTTTGVTAARLAGIWEPGWSANSPAATYLCWRWR